MRSEHAKNGLYMLFRSFYSGEQLSEVDETVQILLAAGMIRVLDGVDDTLE